MSHAKLDQIGISNCRWPDVAGVFRSVHWGDMEIGHTRIPGPSDSTAVYRDADVAGGVCSCPHYGYVLRGRIRCHFPGTSMPDEVVETGEAYFFPAGHLLIYEEETEAVEFNPANALQSLMEQLARPRPKVD